MNESHTEGSVGPSKSTPAPQNQPREAAAERDEDCYQVDWDEAPVNPAQLLEKELRQWCEEVFEDVKPSFFGPMGGVSMPCKARLRFEKRKINGFSDPAGWNKAQQAVLRHALGHDPNDLPTLIFREREYWLNFHLNFGPTPQLKRFPTCPILPGTALLGAHGAAKTVTLCAPPIPGKEQGYVVKTSAFEDGLLQETLALRQLPAELGGPRELGISLGDLNQGHNRRNSWRDQVFRHQNLQTLKAGYNLAVIAELDNLLPLASQALGQLVNSSAPTTSMAEQAELLRREVEASAVHPSLKTRVAELLNRVQDRTPLQPSRLHGDFRRANLLAVPQDLDFEAQTFSFNLEVIDWELSKPGRLGILDFAHLLLDLKDADLNRKPLQEMFATEGELESFNATLATVDLPGRETPANEILALHLATFAFDRAWGFGGPGSGLKYAVRLAGPWPYDQIATQ